MMPRIRSVCFGLFTTLAIVGSANQALAASERFEVTSIKAVRPTLVDLVAALQQKNVAKAKAAIQAYDSAWNGIEVYINVRNKDTYNLLELDLQARITKELGTPAPDMTKLLADSQLLLAKYDDAIKMVASAQPLNAGYDDVARLRIVRAPLREVVPDLKEGKIAEARKSYEAFDSKWDSIEDLVKARSEDGYVAIEKAMIQIEQALMPAKPDVAQVTALVTTVNTSYNAALAEVVKDARAGK
jgi:tetratricopeptide (TPR) repeat protein